MKSVLYVCATLLGVVPFAAAQPDYASIYTWEIVDGEAHILDVKTTLSGEVTIPAELDGYPVTAVGVAELPDGLAAKAGRDGFNGQTRITAVTIPPSVTTIGDDAFRGCTALERVALSSPVTIGEFAFRDCTSLRELDATYFPTTTVYSGSEANTAFYGCANLRFVGPESKVVDGSLVDCQTLVRAAAGTEEVTVPEEITMLGYAAFGGSSQLKTVHFMGPPPSWFYWNAPADNCVFSPSITTVTYRSKYAAEWESFLDGKKTWTVQCAVLNGNSYPVRTMTFNVEPYGTWALQGNAKYLTFEGGTVTGLSNKSVSGELSIPEEYDGQTITGIYQDALTDCTRITSVTVPGSVSTIGFRTFVRMTGMKEIIFQEGVERIELGAFSDCTALNRIVIPASCTEIDVIAFDTCGKITFEVASDNPAYTAVDGALLSKDGRTLLFAPGNVTSYTIPETVTDVAAFAFGTDQPIASIDVPRSVSYLPSTCCWYNTAVRKITFHGNPPEGGIPDVNVWIEGNPWPTSVTGYYPKSRETAWKTAMAADDDGDDAKWHGLKMASYQDITGPAQYLTFEDYGDYLVVAGLSNKSVSGELVIPEEYDGKPVSGIAFTPFSSPFSGCSGLTKITVPGSIKSVYGECFSNCPRLNTIVLSEGVESWSGGIISCPNLETLQVPASCTNVVFSSWECPKLRYAISENNSVYCVRDNAVLTKDGTTFLRYNGAAVDEYAVPEGVQAIAGAFDGTPAIKRLILPSTLRMEEDFMCYAFTNIGAISVSEDNPWLASADGALFDKDKETLLFIPDVATCVVPEGVERLREGLFYNKKTLASVTLPSSLRAASLPLYESCPRLTTIRFPKGFETFDATSVAAFVIPDDTNPALRRIEFAGNPPRFNGYVDSHYLFPTVATGYYPKSRETAWKMAMASDDDGSDTKWQGLKMASYQDIAGPAQYLTYDGGTVTGLSNKSTSGALVIPDEIADMPITGIYQDAFTDCTRITSVTVPGTVSSIGNRTFVRMTGLKEIVFQEGVGRIEWGAFSDCTALNRIVIPASCTSIDASAFDTCHEIAFEVSPDNPAYKSVDGALLTKDGTTLICAPGNVTAYTIPDTVTEIARYAFGAGQSLGTVKLASVTVPESVETIPESAFAFGFGAVNVDAGNPNFSSENGVLYDKDRTALLHVPTTATAFTVPDSVVRIGMGALSECALTSIVFSDMGTLREIGDQAFWGSKLRSLTIPEGVESLGYEIAGCCESLTTIVFPETLTDLGGQGFTDCDALRRVEFHGLPPEGSTGVVLYHDAAKGYYPASYAPAWEAVLNADGTWGEGMPEYGLYALAMAVYDDAPTGTMAQLEFAENGEGVTLVKVPAGFSGALTIPATWRVARGEGAYVRLPVTAIASGAFAGCTRLTSVVVPGSVKTVGDGVFAGCSALTAVTFQEGVGRLEGVVFSDCAKLAKVKMPATLTAIARTPFLEACPEIAFEVASDNPVYQSSGGALLDAGCTRLLVGPGNVATYAVPAGVTAIADYAFAAGQSLGTVKLATVTVPAGVTAIGDYAFAFGIDKVNVDAANPAYVSENGALFDKGMKALLHVPCTLTSYAIPEGVEAIAEAAFSACAVTSVTLPATVRTIGDRAFFESKVRTLVIPEGVTHIGGDAFARCASLTALTLPASLRTWGGAQSILLDGCDALTTITFSGRPDTLRLDASAWPAKATGRYPALWTGYWEAALDEAGTFHGLPMVAYAPTGAAGSLTYDPTSTDPVVTGIATSAGGALEIPQGVTAIAPGALDGASRLTAVTVPGSVATIQAGTFTNLAGLATVTLQEGVMRIEAGAFEGCAKLTKVVIPASCTAIDPRAFANCPDIAIEVAEGNPVYASVDGALLSKDGTVLYLAPGNVTAYAIPGTVTTIASGAFGAGQAQGSKKLASVTIPASVVKIAEGAFAGFGKVTVAEGNPAYASTSDGALFDKARTTLVHVPNTLSGAYTVPEGVVTIATEAFRDCTALTAVTFPTTLAAIGRDAFAGCTKVGTITFLGLPPATVGEGAFGTCTAGAYPNAYWEEWVADMGAEGVWHGLAMTTTPFTTIVRRVGSGTVNDGATNITTFLRTMSYQPGQTVTLTATPAKGYVFLGWSGAGIETHGAEATFPAGGAPEITAHFVTQAVADSMEAVGVGGVDSSLEEALANGDVFTKEQIQEMAFGAPLFEVKDGEATIGLTLRTAEALDGDWEALKPSDVVVGADGTISIKVSVEGKTRFYKFVVPEK